MQSLENLAKLNAKSLIISIPDNRKALRFKLILRSINIEKVISVPFTGINRNINNNKEHHWEIWHKNAKKIVDKFITLEKYCLVKHYRLFERHYQHFFILEKK
jgi:hypothetical protein